MYLPIPLHLHAQRKHLLLQNALSVHQQHCWPEQQEPELQSAVQEPPPIESQKAAEPAAALAADTAALAAEPAVQAADIAVQAADIAALAVAAALAADTVVDTVVDIEPDLAEHIAADHRPAVPAASGKAQPREAAASAPQAAQPGVTPSKTAEKASAAQAPQAKEPAPVGEQAKQ